MGSAEKFPNVLPSYINGHPSTKQITRTIVDIQQLLKQMDTFHCRCGGHLQTKIVDRRDVAFQCTLKACVTESPGRTLQRMKPG